MKTLSLTHQRWGALMQIVAKPPLYLFAALSLAVITLFYASTLHAATPSVSAGGGYTVALKSDGSVWAWGSNYSGQLGNNSTTNSLVPVRVVGLSGVVAVAGGGGHTVALKSDGSVWAWGFNGQGQVGSNSTTNSLVPVQVVGLSGVVAVAAGLNHTVALKSDGSVWAWGAGRDRQLGNNYAANSRVPVQVVGLSGAVAVSAGDIHTAAVKSDGSVWAWGNGLWGKLGNQSFQDSLVPVQVVGLSGAVAVSAGTEHTLALKSDGSVWAWGDNGHGQLGDYSTVISSVPVQAVGFNSAVAVSTQNEHTVVLKSDGSVWASGDNGYGQLGNNSWEGSRVPVPVVGLSGVAAVSAGRFHTAAVKSDGSVWAWGGNYYGQLGNNSTADSPVPVPVLGPAGLGFLNLGQASEPPPPEQHAVLLLHGMNSTMKTWNKLVDSDAGFDKHCTNTRATDFNTTKPVANSEGVYCFRMNFGMHDRNARAPSGLDGKTCSENNGCAGDYSTFTTLGIEVGTAIRRIKSKLGDNTKIVLLGHSRGGLAARAFLQGNNPAKSNVVGLITTGTPHAGSPLGRYYFYLNDHCTPESEHSGRFDACFSDWRFANAVLISDVGGLDMKAPTIGFLAEDSLDFTKANPDAIKDLNNNVSRLPNIKYTQIFYNGIRFGCLGAGLINDFDPAKCGYDIFSKDLKHPSQDGLNTVLNGRARKTLGGDGIVLVSSQKMSELVGFPASVNSNRTLYGGTVHIAEPSDISSLTQALKNIWLP